MKKSLLIAPLVALTLTGCAGGAGGGAFGSTIFRLVEAREHRVGDNDMAVTPTMRWNKLNQRLLTFRDVRDVEDWTLNGPYLDSVTFVTGLKEGETLVYQRDRDLRQVPEFDPQMTSIEIASMLESAYRVRGGAVQFEQTGLVPRQFLGQSGFQMDFDYLGGNELWHRGRAVGAVVEGALFLIMLDGARQHYFDAALPDFEAMAKSARITGEI